MARRATDVAEKVVESEVVRSEVIENNSICFSGRLDILR